LKKDLVTLKRIKKWHIMDHRFPVTGYVIKTTTLRHATEKEIERGQDLMIMKRSAKLESIRPASNPEVLHLRADGKRVLSAATARKATAKLFTNFLAEKFAQDNSAMVRKLLISL
jgi:hypothetical protein